ncbi:MAG: hypothetical protein ACYDH5_19150 [Acidimicrobiales bacterium]
MPAPSLARRLFGAVVTVVLVVYVARLLATARPLWAAGLLVAANVVAGLSWREMRVRAMLAYPLRYEAMSTAWTLAAIEEPTGVAVAAVVSWLGVWLLVRLEPPLLGRIGRLGRLGRR